jgi:hypothetical protein
MRRLGATAIGSALAFCGTWAASGCGTRFVGHVSRDAGGPAVEAGLDVGGGVDARADAVADLPPDASSPPPDLPPICTVDGWCWTHPLPAGDQLVDAVKVGADDVWLIGAAGTIVRFTDGKLSAIPPPASTLAAIWATAAGDVWVGGTSGPYRWDGQMWRQIGITTDPGHRGVNAFWGCAPDDIWAMGPIATRWDGQSWPGVTVPSDALLTDSDFRAVWGSGCDDIWTGSLADASGTGAIYHFDGSTWTKVEQRPAEEIAGIGRSNVWSLAQGRLFHSNGVDPGVRVSDGIVSLSAIGTDRVGVMSDARAVSLLTGDGAQAALSASAPDGTSTLRGWAPNDIWALGAPGTAAHWNGTGWERHLPAWLLSGEDATRVTGGAPGDVWAIVGDVLLRRDGTSWQVALTADQVGGQIVDIWAPGPDEVWVLGADDLIHELHGGEWTAESPLAGTGAMRAISGTGTRDVWVVRGTNTVVHWDGNDWIARDATLYYGGAANTINAIWAAAPDDLWVVGDGISHWLNGGWVATPKFASDVVGVNGPYVAVAGTGPSDVHFLVASGYVLKATNDNLTLTEELSVDNHPIGLAAAAPAGVWAVFDDPRSGVSRLFQLGADGDGGTPFRSLTAPAGIRALWSAPDGTLWAAGKAGALLRRAPTP